MENKTINNIETELYGTVLCVRFDRPAKKNALTIAMYERLNEILKEASQNPAIRVLVFSSTSDSFTAGNDLRDFLRYATGKINDDAPVFRFIHDLAKFDKPIVSAVDGLAVGIGLTMLLHCDFVYVTERTKLMAPFVNLGLVPELGSSKLLVELIGERRAAEILLLGNSISGERAVDLGIANEIISAGKLEAKALHIAKNLSEKPPAALRLSKDLIRPRGEILKTMKKENDYIKRQLQSREAIEAITAVLEKRKPDFSQF